MPSRFGSRGRRFRHRATAALTALAAGILMVTGGPAGATAQPQAQRQFTAMTQNLYLGTNLTPLFGVSGPALVVAATQVYAQVGLTDFPDRATAIAAEIASEAPDVVGLQEVALWKKGPDPAHLTTTYDFLATLEDALADVGAPYRAVAVNVNFNPSLLVPFGALPILDPAGPGGLSWVSFTDRDAILVRSDLPVSQLQWSNPTSQNFQATIPVSVNGGTIHVPRGWSTVDVKFRGKSYRVANTHLEAYSAAVRNLQGQELAGVLAASPLPVVLLGDLNSRPTDATGPYPDLIAGGFVDSWPEAMDGNPGFTSGQSDAPPDPLDCSRPSTIDHRIDFVLHTAGGSLRAVDGTGDVVGESPSDCTVPGPLGYPLWPSDHAGVAMTLHIGQP